MNLIPMNVPSNYEIVKFILFPRALSIFHYLQINKEKPLEKTPEAYIIAWHTANTKSLKDCLYYMNSPDWN
jgi:hypothetical protein